MQLAGNYIYLASELVANVTDIVCNPTSQYT